MLRIQGLVREFNRVRAHLRDGIPPDQAEAFGQRVAGIVAQVEAMCRRSGTTPGRLPAPSRAAYRFLKDLDLRNLPLAPTAAPVRTDSTFRLKNILAVEGQLAERMWAELPTLLESADAFERLHLGIEHQASAIEAMCSRAGSIPGALALPSRRVYCWLKFLADQNNLALHLQALQRSGKALAGVHERGGLQFQLLLVHIQALWTTRADDQFRQLKVNEGFMGAGDEIWAALIRAAISGRGAADRELIHRYAQAEDFSEILVEIDAFAEPPADSSRGRIYSLDESFGRVNRAYFGGAMPKPRLEWNRMLTGRKFGHYRQHRDTVMLSVSLDDERVPLHTVDFVMYHELLHKKHGALLVGGRRFVHTAAFRADERLFAHYEDAQRHLDALAQNGGLLDQRKAAPRAKVLGVQPEGSYKVPSEAGSINYSNTVR